MKHNDWNFGEPAALGGTIIFTTDEAKLLERLLKREAKHENTTPNRREGQRRIGPKERRDLETRIDLNLADESTLGRRNSAFDRRKGCND